MVFDIVLSTLEIGSHDILKMQQVSVKMLVSNSNSDHTSRQYYMKNLIKTECKLEISFVLLRNFNASFLITNSISRLFFNFSDTIHFTNTCYVTENRICLLCNMYHKANGHKSVNVDEVAGRSLVNYEALICRFYVWPQWYEKRGCDIIHLEILKYKLCIICREKFAQPILPLNIYVR